MSGKLKKVYKKNNLFTYIPNYDDDIAKLELIKCSSGFPVSEILGEQILLVLNYILSDSRYQIYNQYKEEIKGAGLIEMCRNAHKYNVNKTTKTPSTYSFLRTVMERAIWKYINRKIKKLQNTISLSDLEDFI